MYNMTFNTKELEALHFISRGKRTIDELSKALGLSRSETYRTVDMLRQKYVLDPYNPISINASAFAKRLYILMSKGPGMARFISDRRLDVLVFMLEPSTVESIVKNTGMSESYVRKILGIFSKGGMVKRADGKYGINDKNHPGIRAMLLSYLDHIDVFDPSVPREAYVLYRNGEEVIYSIPDKADGNPTGFSLFEKYGVEGMMYGEEYYTTRKGEIDIGTVFEDAYRIAKVENDWRLRMATEMFYIRNKEAVQPNEDFLKKHETVMNGGHVDGWPSRKDIDDRMWMVRT